MAVQMSPEAVRAYAFIAHRPVPCRRSRRGRQLQPLHDRDL